MQTLVLCLARGHLWDSQTTGEDIDWGRDDFQVEIANQGVDNVRVDLAQVELRFILAQ